MKNWILAVILGGIAAFVWSSISWTVLPWHESYLSKFSNESAVTQALRENAPSSGLYLMHDYETSAEAGGMKKPFVYASITPEPVGMSAAMLLISLLTQIAGAFLITVLVSQARGMNYWSKVQFSVVIGLAAGILSHVPNWTWWQFPATYALVGISDFAITWFLAGLVIAKFAPVKAEA